MSKMNLWGAIVIALSFIVACSHAQKTSETAKPAWVQGQSQAPYDGTRYMTAVGSGSSREEAIAKAKQEMATIFSQKIESEIKSQSSGTLTEDSMDKVEGKTESQTETQLSIQTDVTLKGVEIKETFEDPSSNTFYAWAILDRTRVKNLYLLELNKIRSRIEGLYQEDFLKKPSAKTAKEILKEAELFDGINAYYAVVNNGHGSRPPLSQRELVKIKAAASAIRQGQPVLLGFHGENPEFESLIANCLTENEYPVLQSAPQNTDQFYRADVQFRGAQKHLNAAGWVKFSYTAEARVYRGSKQIGNAVAQSDQSGRTPEMCFDKAKESLSKDLCQKIVNLIHE